MADVEIFYSLRSPYCYLLTNRLVYLSENFDVDVIIRPVYPIAIRDPEFFKRVDPLYRQYHLNDSLRLAEYLQIPYRRPVPDPIVQNLETSSIDAHQPYIKKITLLSQAAADQGIGLKFISVIMNFLWNGKNDDWDKDGKLAEECNSNGINYTKLDKISESEEIELEQKISCNQNEQRASGHWGVPLMKYQNMPFYGQDRFDLLCWYLTRDGLQKACGK